MLLISHILIALAGIGITTFAYFRPTNNTLRVAYVAAGATFATGVVLMVQNPAHLVPACVSGVVYFGIVAYGISLAKKKLARSTYL